MKKRILSFLMAVLMLFTLLPVSPVCVEAAADTVTVTVNFVYRSTMSMVAQPFIAQMESGSAFRREIAAPSITNYSIPIDLAEGLGRGITFADNTVSFDLASVTRDITVNLYYVAGQAQYTVNHYYQNLTDDGYGTPATNDLVGDIDAYTEAIADTSRTGFYCTGVPQYIIAADGTTTVNIYYDRYYYTVVFDVNGGVNGPDPIYAKYGTEYDAAELPVPARAGYDFAGWAPSPSGIVDGNVTYQAQWTPVVDSSDYTIVFWGQNANDDNYSYLNSHSAYGVPGDTVTWNADHYICEGSHEHSASCYNMTCTQEEHTHSEACGISCTHTAHTAACYGGTQSASPASGVVSAFANLKVNGTTGLKSGYIYRLDCNAALGNHGDNYYLYFDGDWYQSSAANCYGGEKDSEKGNFAGNHAASNRETAYVYEAKLNCAHVHDDSCYNCGKEEHTHSTPGGSCYTLICGKTAHTHSASCQTMGDIAPDAALWVYDHSDTVVVDADGSTVLNVYFNRKEFTQTFRHSNNGTVYGTITDRWGADISTRFTEICSSSGYVAWHPSRSSGSSFTNYIGIMPKYDELYTRSSSTSSGTQTMTYYGEDLNGEYQVMFTLYANFGGAHVTEEDRYTFEGFVYDHGTANGQSMAGAKFYYKRQKYDMSFYSSSQSDADRTEKVPYQANLADYEFDNPTRPADVEADAVFMGWYQNPQCTGDSFDFAAHTMPSNNLALYARWVPGLYTVETFTDNTLTTPYTYSGYNGKEENIIKYTLAAEVTDPEQEGAVFVGWFYEEEGVEKPFSFTMPITKDYQLYPKFSTTAIVNFIVHYYKEGTTDKVADDRIGAEMIGKTITEKAKVGTQLNLVTDYNSYFPDKTSTSIVITRPNMEIFFYYTEENDVSYTVKYQDPDGNDLIDPANKTTNYSVVVEQYVPIEHYTARQFSIQQEINSAGTTVIVFIYDENTVTIEYVPVCFDTIPAEAGSVCGTVSIEAEEVGIVTGTIGGSTAEASTYFRFDGWYSDEECLADAFLTAEAQYTPTEKADATYYAKFVLYKADYTVEHYRQKLSGDGYELMTADTETLTGVIGESTEASAKTYTGYQAVTPITQQTVAADDSDTVCIYYDRILSDAKALTVYGDAGFSETSGTGEYAYGAAVEFSAVLKPGYEFVGWYDAEQNGNLVSDSLNYSFTMPDHDISFYAKSVEQTVNYQYYAVCKDSVPAGTTFGTVSVTEETVGKATGTPSSTATAGGTEYVFAGWYDNADCTGTPIAATATFIPANKDSDGLLLGGSFYALFTYGEAEYTVKHFLQNVDGNGYTERTEDKQELTGLIGTDTAAEANTYEGFTAQTFTQKKIAADDSDTVEIYYNRNTFTISYIVAGDSPDADRKDEYTFGAAVSPYAPSQTHYIFDGWYTDAAYTTKWTAPSVMPAGNITVYGRFIRQTAKLRISKTGMSDGENAIFTVKGEGLPSEGFRVAVASGEEVTLSGLLVGASYTVSEDSGWSYRYESVSAQSVTVAEEGQTYSCSFTNTAKNMVWLCGEARCRNVFNTNPAPLLLSDDERRRRNG